MSTDDIRFSTKSEELPDRATAIAEAKSASTQRRSPVRVERDDGAERLVFVGGHLLEFWYEADGKRPRSIRG